MKAKFILRALFLCSVFFFSTSICEAQFARYKRSAGVIELDLGTASIKKENIQRIYVQMASGGSSVYSGDQVRSAAGIGLASYVYSLPAPRSMPADLNAVPVQLDIVYKPSVDKPDLSLIPVPVEEIDVPVDYEKMLEKVEQGLKSAEGKDDAELYVSGDVTTAVGSSPNWVVDAKYEREFTVRKFPLVIAPFANLSYNSKVKGDTDKLAFGVKFIRGFAFAPAESDLEVDRRTRLLLEKNLSSQDEPIYRQLKRARAQREYFQYSGSLQFESDWDFRVNNLITSQELRYLVRPKFFKNSEGEINGKIIFTPFGGVELGRNLRNPISDEDRGIARLKSGAVLTINADRPFGNLFGKELVWESTFTQRWFALNERAFDKDDNGALVLKTFGKKPRSHFKSTLELKLTDYFGPAITYEWGEEPPLYEKVNHKLKFGLVYSFSRKPIP